MEGEEWVRRMRREVMGVCCQTDRTVGIQEGMDMREAREV